MPHRGTKIEEKSETSFKLFLNLNSNSFNIRILIFISNPKGVNTRSLLSSKGRSDVRITRISPSTYVFILLIRAASIRCRMQKRIDARFGSFSGAHSSGTGLRPELNFPLPSAAKSCSFASKVKRNFRTAGVETRPGETPPFHPGNAFPTDEAATFNPNRIAKLDPARRNETR